MTRLKILYIGNGQAHARHILAKKRKTAKEIRSVDSGKPTIFYGKSLQQVKYRCVFILFYVLLY